MAKERVWEQPPITTAPPQEDLLVSPKTHFKPIRDYREELPPPLAFLLPIPQVGLHFFNTILAYFHVYKEVTIVFLHFFLHILEQDPAEYGIYNLTANSTFPLRFKVKSENDKAVQTEFPPSPPPASSH